MLYIWAVWLTGPIHLLSTDCHCPSGIEPTPQAQGQVDGLREPFGSRWAGLGYGESGQRLGADSRLAGAFPGQLRDKARRQFSLCATRHHFRRNGGLQTWRVVMRDTSLVSSRGTTVHRQGTVLPAAISKAHSSRFSRGDYAVKTACNFRHASVDMRQQSLLTVAGDDGRVSWRVLQMQMQMLLWQAVTSLVLSTTSKDVILVIKCQVPGTGSRAQGTEGSKRARAGAGGPATAGQIMSLST